MGILLNYLFEPMNLIWICYLNTYITYLNDSIDYVIMLINYLFTYRNNFFFFFFFFKFFFWVTPGFEPATAEPIGFREGRATNWDTRQIRER